MPRSKRQTRGKGKGATGRVLTKALQDAQEAYQTQDPAGAPQEWPPDGGYDARMTGLETDVRQNKDGASYVSCGYTFVISDGDYEDTKIYKGYNTLVYEIKKGDRKGQSFAPGLARIKGIGLALNDGNEIGNLAEAIDLQKESFDIEGGLPVHLVISSRTRKDPASGTDRTDHDFMVTHILDFPEDEEDTDVEEPEAEDEAEEAEEESEEEEE